MVLCLHQKVGQKQTKTVLPQYEKTFRDVCATALSAKSHAQEQNMLRIKPCSGTKHGAVPTPEGRANRQESFSRSMKRKELHVCTEDSQLPP